MPFPRRQPDVVSAHSRNLTTRDGPAAEGFADTCTQSCANRGWCEMSSAVHRCEACGKQGNIDKDENHLQLPTVLIREREREVSASTHTLRHDRLLWQSATADYLDAPQNYHQIPQHYQYSSAPSWSLSKQHLTPRSFAKFDHGLSSPRPLSFASSAISDDTYRRAVQPLALAADIMGKKVSASPRSLNNKRPSSPESSPGCNTPPKVDWTACARNNVVIPVIQREVVHASDIAHATKYTPISSSILPHSRAMRLNNSHNPHGRVAARRPQYMDENPTTVVSFVEQTPQERSVIRLDPTPISCHSSSRKSRLSPQQREICVLWRIGDLRTLHSSILIEHGHFLIPEHRLHMTWLRAQIIDHAIVIEMITMQTDQNFKDFLAKFSDWLFTFAVQKGCTEVVQSLLRSGANVNRKDCDTGLTPLHRAIFARSPAMVRLLISNGAVPSIDSNPALGQPQVSWVERIVSTLSYSEKTSDSPQSCKEETSGPTGENQQSRPTKSHTRGSSIATEQSPLRHSSSDDWDISSENDEDDRPPKRPRRLTNTDSDTCHEGLPKLACPYLIRYPDKFSVDKCCGLKGYDNIPRLKFHLKQKHRIYQCERCGDSSFTSDDQVSSHSTTNECHLRLEQPRRDFSDGFNERQSKEIEKRWRHEKPEWKWARIFGILFGLNDADPRPSPYFETRAQLQDQNERLHYENQQLRQAMRDELARHKSVEEVDIYMHCLMSKLRGGYIRHQAQVFDDRVTSDDGSADNLVMEASPVRCTTFSPLSISNPIHTQQAPDLGAASPCLPPEPNDSQFMEDFFSFNDAGYPIDDVDDDTETPPSLIDSAGRVCSNESAPSTGLNTSIDRMSRETEQNGCMFQEELIWDSGKPILETREMPGWSPDELIRNSRVDMF